MLIKYLFLLENLNAIGFFKCENEEKFIDLDKICDDVINCKYGNDELFCIDEELECPEHCSCRFQYEAICQSKTLLKFFDVEKFSEKKLKFIEMNEIKILKNKFFSYQILHLKIINSRKISIKEHFFTPNLVYLNVTRNSLSSLANSLERNYALLQYLDISNNPIGEMAIISNFFAVRFIDASYTNLKSINKKIFGSLKYLTKLILKGCLFKTIGNNIFYLSDLREVDIRQTILPVKKISYFVKNLKKLVSFKSDYFSLCCNLLKNVETIKECSPSTSIFKTCTDLIGSIILRVIIWIFGIFTILQNGFALYINLTKGNFITSCFSGSLSMSDFGIGIYLICISIQSVNYQGEFFKYEDIWTKSLFCTFLGCFMNFSLLNSSLSIFLISLQKYIAIKYPMNQLLTKKKILLIAISGVCICIGLAILPMILYEVL